MQSSKKLELNLESETQKNLRAQKSFSKTYKTKHLQFYLLEPDFNTVKHQ